MFVRFRKMSHRLAISLVETRRIAGKVHSEHVASLGSVEMPLPVADRIRFWQRLHDRLARLGNRHNEAQAKVLSAVHARVPMVTADEQRALQLENAKADAAVWSSLHGMHASTVEDHKALAAKVTDIMAQNEAAAAEAASNAKAAQNRIERIERGENVEGGLGNPMTREEWIAHVGLKPHDLRRMEHAMAVDALGEEAWEELLREHHRETERAYKRISIASARKVLRRRLHDAPEGKREAARKALFAFSKENDSDT
jgi:hypothetical protein